MAQTANINLHGVTGVRVNFYFPANSNGIELHLMQGDGIDVGPYMSLTMYDLPEDDALRIVKALSDAQTTVYVPSGRQNVTDYLVSKGVFDAIEGK